MFNCRPVRLAVSSLGLVLLGLLVMGPETSEARTPSSGLAEPDSAAPDSLPAILLEPFPLYERGVMGPYTRPITTRDAEAQAFFDQGLQLFYSFAPVDAARSFHEAQKRDPSCAICFWGEALAWGPFLNGALRGENAPRAYEATQEAVGLLDRATPVEQALIEAMAVRYTPTHDPTTRAALDSLYADAMADVHARFPNDHEVGTLYAESLMILEPRRGNWDIEKPSVALIHRVLGGVLDRDLTHPGACHLYIHATESTIRPDLAEACADVLTHTVPGASHMNHMPSHTYNRVGRWGDATRSNLEAWHSDQRAEFGEGFAIYPTHNLHMLLFSASYDGQGAIAIQAAKDYAKLVEDGEFYRVLTKLRFGRFDEILLLANPPENPVFRGLWDFGRGYAHLHQGTADSAAHYLARVDEAAGSHPDAQFRGHTAEDLLGVVSGILRSEIHRKEGQTAQAIRALEVAVELEDGLRYDEPEPLPFSARHWLGALHLEAGNPSAAETVYQADLEKHPRNGWSLLGLAQALEAQDRTEEAAQVRGRLQESWVRSDTWLRSSRF